MTVWVVLLANESSANKKMSYKLEKQVLQGEAPSCLRFGKIQELSS